MKQGCCSVLNRMVRIAGAIRARLPALLLPVLLCSCTAHQKHFEDVRIIFFPGGGPDQSFSRLVFEGAKAAENDLGCHMEYSWSYWDENKIVDQFREAIYAKPDAICIVGHPGEERMRPLAEEAFYKGILVTFLNADLPGIKKDFMRKGCGYVGQDTYRSGYVLSEALVRKTAPQGPGEVHVLTWDYFPGQTLSHRARRSQGLIEALNDQEIPLHHSEIPAPMRGACRASDLAELLKQVLQQHPNTKTIITDSGDLTAALPEALRAIGRQPGDIIGAGFDLSAMALDGLKSGYLMLVHDQQPYLQGYLSVLQACLSVRYGFAGLNIDTGSGLIDNSNLDMIEDLVLRHIR